jgi:hypothetical protein
MNAPPVTPSASAYAVKLLAHDAGHPERLAGRLEHVLSGRRHDFANGPALLACLVFEQQQVALDAAVARSTESP